VKHLIVSREYPPAPYAPGGIGTYVSIISRLLAERGETVHVIAQRWRAAPEERETFYEGRLIVHRIGESDLPNYSGPLNAERLKRELEGLKATAFSNQWFAWHAAFLGEHLIEHEGIDVVEGQDWEAPLYYFLLRRAIGAGPTRRSACIIHLHSPTVFLRRFNGADSNPAPYMLMKRMEEFCIRSADALLCPSHYFAAQSRAHFGLQEDAIKVIHLPVGFTPKLERSAKVWADGSICYIGRLEPRKGVVEWVEAASSVARQHPTTHFDFVGADIWGLRRPLLNSLPPALRSRFRFHGSKAKADLAEYLAAAKAAVVPSRWENFPNVCIEAMSSGLPVIATRLGGMVELIDDGRSGWLAPDTGVSGMVEGLAGALRRCLTASGDQRAAMGETAAKSVRQICDNETIVNAHIAFRTHVASLGARQPSSQLNLVAKPNPGRTANIVIWVASIAAAERVLLSLQTQTAPPHAITVVYGHEASGTSFALAQWIRQGVVFRHLPDGGGADAWNLGFTALRSDNEHGFWLFLDHADTLEPTCLEKIENTFARRPEVGIVSLWTTRTVGTNAMDAPPCPEALYQLINNDVPPASAFRTAALGDEPPFGSGMQREYDIWQVANSVMAKGWRAVSIPEVLAVRSSEKPAMRWPQVTAQRAIRAELLSPFKAQATQVALDLVDDFVPLPGNRPCLRRRLIRALETIILNPLGALRSIRRRAKTTLFAVGQGFHFPRVRRSND
jgi:glycosyltransferase involved in cell wall biosynthesis